MQFAVRDLTASRNAKQRAALLGGEPPSFTWATSAGGCIFKSIQLALDMLFISTLSFFMRAHVKPDARLKNAALDGSYLVVECFGPNPGQKINVAHTSECWFLTRGEVVSASYVD
jgi:hypothetical protein